MKFIHIFSKLISRIYILQNPIWPHVRHKIKTNNVIQYRHCINTTNIMKTFKTYSILFGYLTFIFIANWTFTKFRSKAFVRLQNIEEKRGIYWTHNKRSRDPDVHFITLSLIRIICGGLFIRSKMYVSFGVLSELCRFDNWRERISTIFFAYLDRKKSICKIGRC